MVVVAIIGILSSIAVPSYKKYSAYAKTTEAKLKLSSMFAAEESFYSEYGVYASCLGAMGYSDTPNNNYYCARMGGDNTTKIHVTELAKK